MPMPKTLVKEYLLEIVYADGSKKTYEEKENFKRNVLIPVEREVVGVKLTVNKNWGDEEKGRVFTFEVL